MTAVAFDRARAARPLVWLVMPAMAVVNQYLAMRTAQTLGGLAFGATWLVHAGLSHWVQGWVVCEIVTFSVWMVVLSDLSLSAAFPMTALGYVLVIGLGWTIFGERVTPTELAGGAAILAGVWLLSDREGRA
jgi:multidrug transporter EmrE-like cation transporter